MEESARPLLRKRCLCQDPKDEQEQRRIRLGRGNRMCQDPEEEKNVGIDNGPCGSEGKVSNSHTRQSLW